MFVLAVLLLITVVGFATIDAPQQVVEPLRHIVRPSRDLPAIRQRVGAELAAPLAEIGASIGAPIYMRIFKEERHLELWVQGDDAQFALFRTYPICNYSGALGPKLKEGDRQSPEGFYRVDAQAMNPRSSFHLSFNLGFPNRFDRAQGRTGSYLMVHGNCVSVGCYAMTDPAIEEIYVLAEAALRAGQPSFAVHAFPFRMTPARMARAKEHKWFSFWETLQPGYAAFEATYIPPEITVENARYAVAD